jgi:tetratricopeptide (TPR) repeat protein
MGIALVLAGCLMAGSRVCAQTPQADDQAKQNKTDKAGKGQKPAANAPAQAAPQGGGNAFPEDTSTVPVMPSKISDLPTGTYGDGDSAAGSLPEEDLDPVKSPEQAGAAGVTTSGQESSSDVQSMDSLLPKPGEEEPARKGKKGAEIEDLPKETPQEDISVGKYYLDQKNWRAALSRFQSALVLSPDEPDVYWGLAESERHLGNYAEAKANYLKVIEYDPDSKRAKEAKKALQEPEMAKVGAR